MESVVDNPDKLLTEGPIGEFYYAYADKTESVGPFVTEAEATEAAKAHFLNYGAEDEDKIHVLRVVRVLDLYVKVHLRDEE